jgi:putative addiction module CopG family antidote
MNVTLSPELKLLIDAKTSSGRYADAGEVVREALRLMAARDQLRQAGGAGSDIEALVQIVMMEAAQEAEAELRAILAETQARNAAKKALRELLGRVKRDQAANELRREYEAALDFSRGLGSERAYHRVRLPVADPEAPGGLRWVAADLAGEKITRLSQLDCAAAELQDKLDSLSEMSDMLSLRLQMLMDRRAKMMETLSNIMKKMGETAETLVGNMK